MTPKQKDQEEITFPYVYSKGSVSVKIYRTPTKGCEAFTLVYWQDGTRKKPTFNTFEKALTEAKVVVDKLGSSAVDVLDISSADRAAYLRAKQLLGDTPIEVAAAEYAQMKKLLGRTSPIRAAEDYVKQNPVEQEPKLVSEVIDELIKAKRGDGVSQGYIKHLGYDLGKFNQQFGGYIADVTGADIDGWLRGLNASPRTRNNLRCTVHTLFNYAKSRKYLPKDHNELEAVSRAKDRGGEIEIFKPSELVEIFVHANPEVLPFLTVGAFAGIRHAEIQRLQWEDVQIEDELIEMHAGKTKTASRRTIPITPNLKAWLMSFRQETGPVCSYSNMGFALHKIAKAINLARRATWAAKHGVSEEQLAKNDEKARSAAKAPLRRRQKREVPPGAETAAIENWTPFAWKHNALRHSFISYRLADIQNVAQVSLEAGNSPQMIHQHYKELVRPKEAKEWFAVMPAMVEAVKEAGKAAKEASAEKVVTMEELAAVAA